MCLLAAWASWLRGTKYVHEEEEDEEDVLAPSDLV
jgi:hypothetical protein